MEKVLHVQSVNDYARHVGARVLHPLVSVIRYDELHQCRHALCEYGVYGLFLMNESPYTISYGSGNYRFESGSLMCVAPGQRGGVTDDGEIIHIKGWVLLFHPDFLAGTPLERRIKDYHYFSYYSNEALILTPDEWARLERCLAAIRKELEEFPEDSHLQAIVISYLSLLLELAARFYERQFQGESSSEEEFSRRIDAVLERYYAEGKHLVSGVPTVRYLAGELFLSPNYFGDLVRVKTGESASVYIRHFVMQKAKSMLLGGRSVSDVSEALGFEYPQNLTRMFKKEFGIAPSKIEK
ncbi:MAG: AraC family transcriptional regulator [Bacteroidales bacterium]|nr:AraC family transcriptional regulator [Bacteroidales bacterium]